MELKIYYSNITTCNDPSQDVRKLLGDVPAHDICSLVLFSLESQEGYHRMLKEYKSAVYEYLGREVPVTLVPQPLLDGCNLAAEIYTFSSPEIRYCTQSDVTFGLLKTEFSSMIFIEGIASSSFSDSVKTQSEEVFNKLDKVLTDNGFHTGDIVRQWNYIGNITAHRDGRQNYQEFNDTRSTYYHTSQWHHGYPAATGIGADSQGIIVGCIAYKSSVSTIYPLNNPLQIAAHEYSKQVLIDNNTGAIKSTPKFERAKLIEVEGRPCCFVSGTAAIRGEQSMEMKSARMQTVQTIENIEYLVSKQNLVNYGCKPYDLKFANLRVYIKNAEDYLAVKETVEDLYPQVPVIYTIADVCRDELLVEIEGILV
jgi:enamine deaminase RidA (YjgF/YER057c/UK114 family)